MERDDELQQVEQDIERAKRSAMDAHVIEDPEVPHFYESGELSEFDDQTIAPPG
jgi:hypothetical protein